jgi:predicted DNA-binding transcriptional regulator AlpA
MVEQLASIRRGRSARFKDELLTAQDLADLLHVNVQSIYDQRHRGTGPRGIRPAGGKLLFRRSDVDAWLDQHADKVEAT